MAIEEAQLIKETVDEARIPSTPQGPTAETRTKAPR